jgi:hypothetical protein
MKISRSVTYAVGVLAAAALVAGCSGGSGSQATGITPISQSGASSHAGAPLGHRLQDAFIGSHPSGAIHPDHHKSWISKDIARAPRLFFASDYGVGDVYIYTMPGMSLKATLTGFSGPQGLCNDSKGDIFVNNTNTLQVLELSRTGTLLNTFNDTYGYPVGCAVDPASGDLAVTDIFGLYGAGQVVVWPGANPSATPHTISNPSQYFYYFDGYGPGSSLWVSGRNSYGTYMLSGCGASSCSTIPLSGGTIYFPGAVQWDNARGNWVVFDQLCNDTNAACSYTVSDSGVLGNQTTYLAYNGSNICDMVQGVIAANNKKYVAGGDYEYCGTASSSNDRWAYPAGGQPTNYVTYSSYYNEPIGAAISTK